MSYQIIKERLEAYAPQSKQEKINALKEIFQELAVASLARTAFFRCAAFQGGTCLRILYGLNRFSEDLDFILLKEDNQFAWDIYLSNLQEAFHFFNLSLSVQDRSKAGKAMQQAFIKEDSFGKILTLEHKLLISEPQAIKIKLEVDTQPLQGSEYETKILDFPYVSSILVQDMPSLFAGKCHALLARKFIKGRDWFDFVWYVSRKTPVNWVLLENALNQFGPWKNQGVKLDKAWLERELIEKVNTLDIDIAKNDVVRFLKPRDFPSLEAWGKAFFLQVIDKMGGYLPPCR